MRDEISISRESVGLTQGSTEIYRDVDSGYGFTRKRSCYDEIGLIGLLSNIDLERNRRKAKVLMIEIKEKFSGILGSTVGNIVLHKHSPIPEIKATLSEEASECCQLDSDASSESVALISGIGECLWSTRFPTV